VAKPKILLVDDVNLMLELQKSFLKFSPVRVFTAYNGVEAIRTARREKPDLIFMDINMPVMDGVTCCTTIKADPELRSIPVIMVTTMGKPEDEILSRKAGCDDFVTKPMDRKTFLDKGRQFIPDIDRREPRVPCETDIEVLSDSQVEAGIARDISEGGVYIATQGAAIPESYITLSLVLPGIDSAPIKVRGRIAWINSEDDRKKPRMPLGFGVEFLDIDEQALNAIKGYVGTVKPRS
jgi:CheY-like chemotaxis protein